MEINKLLLEDVLLGKLKGTFVFRNGDMLTSDKLRRNHRISLYLYLVNTWSYTPEGLIYLGNTSPFDIVDFIPKCQTIDLEMLKYCRKDFEFMQTLSKAIKNMNTLEIKIPEGKEIDWKQSEKENKIVLKDKQLTYEDICKKLFTDDHYCIGWEGYPIKCCSAIYNANNATTKHQLDCILAKNKLANVAVYLNDGWKPGNTAVWIIEYNYCSKCHAAPIHVKSVAFDSYGLTIFKSRELAEQAIEILGEETVKLALEPLGI